MFRSDDELRQSQDAVVAPPPGVALQLMAALGHGLMVLDRQGRVLHANPAARWICRPGQPLVLADAGRLEAAAEALERLHGLLAEALQGRAGMITLHQQEAVRSVAVVPLTRDAQWPQAGVLLVLGSSGEQPSAALRFFCQEHRITAAETQVLLALAGGETPQEIARRGQVAISTVRTQITSVRRKVRARSIRHLVQIVGALPPLPASGAAPAMD